MQLNPKIGFGPDQVNMEGFNKINKGGVNNKYNDAIVRV